MALGVTHAPSSLDLEVRRVVERYEGQRGRFAYAAFDWINAELFAGELPTPLIVWAITAHGGCLGLTHHDPVRPPKIVLHPSLLGGTEKPDPWGIAPELLGWARAFDVLVHECIHVSVEYRLGGANGPTSHDNPQWLKECTRLAQRLDLGDAGEAKANRPKRKRDENGCSVVRRECEGLVSFRAWSTFPGGVRQALGRLDVYRANELPFAWEGKGNARLRVTTPGGDRKGAAE